MLIPSLLLAAMLALLAWSVRNDRAEYAAFKALTRTEDRQRVLRGWVLRCFLLFWGASLAVLLLLGRAGALLRPPAEFAALTASVHHDFSPGFAPILIGAVIGGAIAGAALAAVRQRRGKSAQPKILGDIEPLFPRNADERRWTALLGANAGVGEELFFRLTLPLLIALVTGDAWAAFAAAGLIFGLVHFYQGWVGILATTVAGFVFAALYLASGQIWLPILLHAVMNLNSLWLRPLLAERAKARDVSA
jgi:membrane protease YdiL (CAAX protease family)